MEYLNIIIATLGAISVIGIAWLGGYQLGQASGIDTERELANRRVNALLKKENARKPRRRASK
jgi:hypothetical protein